MDFVTNLPVSDRALHENPYVFSDFVMYANLLYVSYAVRGVRFYPVRNRAGVIRNIRQYAMPTNYTYKCNYKYNIYLALYIQILILV